MNQAVLGFPKYGMIGIGMAQEKEHDRNLPIGREDTPEMNANRIFSHIKCNRKYKNITDKMIKDAIKLIVEAAEKYWY